MKARSTLILLLFLLMVSGATSAQDDLEEVDFFLTFVPNIQFSPVYAANPYMEDAGYTLTIQHGDEPVGVDLIASDNVPFGMISGEQVVMARAAERPVVFVYEWFQSFPVALVIPDTIEADSVEAISGLTVGVPGRFGASYSGITALLAANDLTEDDINLEAIGFNAPDIVCVGGVDASVVYINNEPLQIQARADRGECGDIDSLTVIPVADFVDIVSNGIVTSERQIEENPARVAAVIAAFDAGLRDVINNPARAYLQSLDYVDSLPASDELIAAMTDLADAQDAFLAEDPDTDAITASYEAMLETLQADFDAETLVQFEVLLATIPLWQGEQLGYTDPASWQVTLEVLESMESMVAPLDDIDAAYSNAFLPPVESE